MAFLTATVLLGCHGGSRLDSYAGQEPLDSLERARRDSLDKAFYREMAEKRQRADSIKLAEEREKYKSLIEYVKKMKSEPPSHGTPPSDGMYGFDPWDDVDDAYNLDRNQIDPYPGEW